MEPGVVDGRYLEVLIRPDSKACEAGMAVVLKAAGAMGIAVLVIDVATDPNLRELFAHRVPVVRAPDGAILAEGKVRAARVTAALVRMTVADPKIH